MKIIQANGVVVEAYESEELKLAVASELESKVEEKPIETLVSKKKDDAGNDTKDSKEAKS